MASGTMVYQGQAGHTYTFLALATDVAGNHEQPPGRANVPQDTTTVNLGAMPTVPSTTPPNFGIPPAPDGPALDQPAVHPGAARRPGRAAGEQSVRIQTVLQPFQAQSFATGFVQSDGILGPMAIAQEPDGSFLDQRRRVAQRAVPRSARRRHGRHAARHPALPDLRDGLRQRRAISGRRPAAGRSSSSTRPPARSSTSSARASRWPWRSTPRPTRSTSRPTTASRSSTRRPTPSPSTAATRTCASRAWRSTTERQPLGGHLARCERRSSSSTTDARAQVKLTFDSDIQSIAFGKQGTELENLLFVSHDDAPIHRGARWPRRPPT